MKMKRADIPKKTSGRQIVQTTKAPRGLVIYEKGAILYRTLDASPLRFVPYGWCGTVPGNAKRVTPQRALMLSRLPREAFRTSALPCTAYWIRERFAEELTQCIAAANIILDEGYSPAIPVRPMDDMTYEEAETPEELHEWRRLATEALEALFPTKA